MLILIQGIVTDKSEPFFITDKNGRAHTSLHITIETNMDGRQHNYVTITVPPAFFDKIEDVKKGDIFNCKTSLGFSRAFPSKKHGRLVTFNNLILQEIT